MSQGYGKFVIAGVFNSAAPAPVSGQEVPLQLDASGNLLVNVAVGGGGGGGTQYADGTTQATPTGTVALGKNPSNVLHALALDSSGNLNVNIVAGGGTGGGPADVGLSTAASETDTGRQKVISALRLWDQTQSAGSQLVGWRGDTTSGAWVNVKSIGTVTVTGTVAVSGTVTVAGTVTANQGTASAGAKWSVSVDNTPAVTVSGNVGVTQQTSPWVDNLTQVAGVALGATAVVNFGTAPAAAAVPGVNASLFSGTTGLTNTSGALDVNIKSSGATVTVSGTVTANQGSPPWTVKPDGTVWALTGTSANVDVTNTVSVTFPSAQHVIIDSATLGTVAENLTQVAGTALGATAVVNFGSAPAAVAVPAVNASLFSGTTGLTNTGSALDVNLKTSSITLNVQFPSAQHVIIDSATLGTVTVSGTVTANQGTANATPWNENIAQFGGNPVVTGTGVGGAGIPRVTVSSDSFPATQPVSAASLPLPANAAQESSGNLATIASQTRNDAQIVDLLNVVIRHLQLLNINTASSIPGADSTIDTIDGVI